MNLAADGIASIVPRVKSFFSSLILRAEVYRTVIVLSRFSHKDGSSVSFFTRRTMSNLKDYIYGAGLIPVSDPQGQLANFDFPVVRLNGGSLKTDTEPLFCDSLGSTATLLYFTLPGCENCQPGLGEFLRLGRTVAADDSVSMCLRVVVSDWPTLPELQVELQQNSELQSWGIVWDAQGVVLERLAVLGQPAVYLLDEFGQVSAYRNGSVSFVSPGFESFWQVLFDVIKNRASETSGQGSRVALADEEILVKSNAHVSFLNNDVLPAVWLVGLIVICYSLFRFVLQLRKNFRGS